MAKVSILMNGYNSEEYLKEAIDSIYEQTFKDWEIIFIDNCSTDSTREIVKSYNEKIKYYKTKENVPLGAARNYGLQFCKGEFLAFLDTDDRWLKNKLELQIELMEKNKEYKLCYSATFFIDEKGKRMGSFIPHAYSGNVFPQQLKRYEMNMQTVMLRNDFSISFNENLKYSPDYDLFVEISSKYQVGVIKDYLVEYRKHSSSFTNNNIDLWGLEMEFTLNRLIKSYPFLKKQYENEFILAYSKVKYYKAYYLISINKKDEAKFLLSEIKFIKPVYLFLYIVSHFPVILWNVLHKFK